MNCPNCGAAVKEGKFCNYCGAKLPDDTKRVEVNINKKIEDVAEIKRASYEEEESKLVQKMMKRDLRRSRIKIGFFATYIVVAAILVLPGMFHPDEPITRAGLAGELMFALLFFFGVCYGLYKITR